MAEDKDLELAFNVLQAKVTIYDTFWRYYDGDHPVVYTNERLKEVFRGLDAKFTQNWCAVVVDALQDRVQLTTLQVPGADIAQEVLNQAWLDNEMNLESDDVHEAALVTGEAYFIVWKKEENAPVEGYFNDPRLCHVFYEAENPRAVRFAAKWWDNDAGYRRLTLYYADRLVYYVSRAREPNSHKSFISYPDEPEAKNPYGQIPVFHFRTKRRPVSELKDAIPLQNGVNKLLIDMMVAAEYGAFKQRFVISNSDILGKLKNAPNEIWELPAGDGMGQQTSTGEFSATDLANYYNAIDRIAGSIAIITRTPKHYFWQQGGDLSGEALIAMEAPLNKKAQARIERFTPTWQKIASFMLQLSGHDIPPQDVLVVYEKPETVQPQTRAQIRQIDVGTGIPLHTALRLEGWSDGELEVMEEERAEGQSDIGTQLLKAFETGQ